METIFALSSGAPPAGIAVIRISGPAAHQVLERMAGALPPPRTMALRSIRDPSSGDVLDRGLVVRFAAQGSVTGEAMAELHMHGGRATVDAVLAAIGALPDTRAARAGEFTWRAFQNGRMDLLEIDSLSDLLRAETEAQRRAAVSGMGLSHMVEAWRQEVLQLSALVEAALDQSDEDDVPADRSAITHMLSALTDSLGAMLTRPGAERLFDGIRVVFAGAPNAGKSSLINALVQRDVAITSSVAGTTRDVIEAPVSLGGVAFVLTDTAGLRTHASDEIEREGIRRATDRIEGADIVVWLDEARPACPTDKAIHIFPRSDERVSEASGNRIRVSARTGEGIAELVDRLIKRAERILPIEGEIALTRRQRKHLDLCLQSLLAAIDEPNELILAERLRHCRQQLDELTGRSGTEDMLDSLFATFCIGK